MTDQGSAQLEEKLRQLQDDVNVETSMDDTTTSQSLAKDNPNTTAQDRDKTSSRRNLVIDEERFEETFLKCLICRENYDDGDKLPKMLPCHHTFCLHCLREMFRVEGEYRQSLTSAFRGMPLAVKIHCPTCRDGLITSDTELRRLPNDHTLTELLNFVRDTGKKDVQYCAKHQLQPLNFFCEPCVTPVCCDCTVIDHKESNGHLVVNVEEALAKYSPVLDSCLADIKAQKADLAAQRDSLERATDTVDRIQQDLTDHIRSVFDKIRQTLDNRERELYDISDGEINRRRQMIDAHMATLSEREATLNSRFNDLQKAKDDKDLGQMLGGHREAVHVLQQKVKVPADCAKDFKVTFQFNARHDASVRQQISSLGNIFFQS